MKRSPGGGGAPPPSRASRFLEEAYRSPGAAAEYHDRHRKSAARRWVSHRECRIVSALLGRPSPDARVLDAACGTGRITVHLRGEGRCVVSLDASPEMLRRGLAAGALAPGRTAAGSIFRLPFADKSMEASTCTRFLHHLGKRADRVAALRELARVTAGPVVFSCWTGWNLANLRRRVKRILGRRPGARFAVRLRDLRKEAAEAGLAVERVRFLYPLVSETVYISTRPAEAGHRERET